MVEEKHEFVCKGRVPQRVITIVYEPFSNLLEALVSDAIKMSNNILFILKSFEDINIDTKYLPTMSEGNKPQLFFRITKSPLYMEEMKERHHRRNKNLVLTLVLEDFDVSLTNKEQLC